MKYKNITKKDLFLPKQGLVEAGAIVDSEEKINNKNFELVIKEETPVDKGGEDKKVETSQVDNKIK